MYQQQTSATERTEGAAGQCYQVAGLSVCVSDDDAAKAEAQRAEDDLHAQQDMAEWAKWITLFTGLQIAVGGVGIYYVRNTLLETRRIGRSQVRAYVTVNIEKGIVLLPHRKVLRVQIELINNGETPAQHVRSATGTAVFPYRPPMGTISILPDWDAVQDTGSIIAAQRKIVVNREVPIPSQADIGGLFVHNARIHFVGAVIYKDVFDKQHLTKFCFFLKTDALVKALEAADGATIIDGSGFTQANQWNEMT